MGIGEKLKELRTETGGPLKLDVLTQLRSPTHPPEELSGGQDTMVLGGKQAAAHAAAATVWMHPCDSDPT